MDIGNGNNALEHAVDDAIVVATALVATAVPCHLEVKIRRLPKARRQRNGRVIRHLIARADGFHHSPKPTACTRPHRVVVLKAAVDGQQVVRAGLVRERWQ